MAKTFANSGLHCRPLEGTRGTANNCRSPSCARLVGSSIGAPDGRLRGWRSGIAPAWSFKLRVGRRAAARLEVGALAPARVFKFRSMRRTAVRLEVGALAPARLFNLRGARLEVGDLAPALEVGDFAAD